MISVQQYGTESQRELIKHQLKRLKLTFCELLNTNSHELYHLYNLSRCCQCGPVDKLPEINSIREDQYCILFQKGNELRLKGHPRTTRDSKCCNFANFSVSLDDLDLSLGHTLLMHCCRELLWHCCLAAKNKTLEEFLNDHKHDILHMSILTNQPCRLCNNGIKAKGNGFLQKGDWDLLFVSMASSDDLSLYSAKQGITVSNLNPRLSHSLLQAFSEEVKLCKRLRKIRNSLAHRQSIIIHLDEFKEMWSEIESILLQISNVYGGARYVKEKLHTLNTERSREELMLVMKSDGGIEASNAVIRYIEEHLSTKKENKNLIKSVEVIGHKIDMMQESLNMLQRSSNGIKSNKMEFDVEVNGFKVNLDKSSCMFIQENPTAMEAEHESPTSIGVIYRFAINTLKKVNLLRWMIQYAKQSKHFTMRPNQSVNTVEMDELKCGFCKKIYRTIDDYVEHKKTHQESQTNGIDAKFTVLDLSDELANEFIKFSKRKGTTIGYLTVLDEAKGSLIIWTRMSITAFKTKDAFITAIEQLMQHIFWECPTDMNKTTNLKLRVQIKNVFESGYVDDEEDLFRCGVCLKEFSVLEAFKMHKMSSCKKENTGPLPKLKISGFLI
ncbi:uncharacterized protein [Mytilus edulis]|uniref:uncharacterized protein n=1 Tax=Mytilus edulis TaxID=6550 RepID=UPI0039F116D8